MVRTLNMVTFFGRLASDPVMSTTRNGLAKVTFSFAYNYGYGDKKETHFLLLKAFGRRAELLKERCCKGTQLIAECQIVPLSYEKDGKKVYSTDFWIESMELIGQKMKENDAWNKPLPGSENAVLPGVKPINGNPDDFITVPDGIEDEIPFT